jgi:hypothetical protein
MKKCIRMIVFVCIIFMTSSVIYADPDPQCVAGCDSNYAVCIYEAQEDRYDCIEDALDIRRDCETPLLQEFDQCMRDKYPIIFNPELIYLTTCWQDLQLDYGICENQYDWAFGICESSFGSQTQACQETKDQCIANCP